MPKTKLSLIEQANEAFIKDLGTVLKQPPQALADLATQMDLGKGFRFRSAEDSLKVWAEAKAKPGDLGTTVGLLRHVFEFGTDQERSPDDLIKDLEELCAKNKIAGFEERRELIRQLVTPSDLFKQRERFKSWVEGGFMNLVGIHATVELRGAFESRTSEELIGVIPIAVLRLAIRFDEEDAKQTRRIAFQMTEEDLNRLAGTLDRVKGQLGSLKAKVVGSATVVESVPGGRWEDSDD